MVNYQYENDTGDPSYKQLSFIDSLYDQCRRKGFEFDIEPDPASLKLDMWHTGLLINYLLALTKMPDAPKGLKKVFDLLDYVAEAKKIPKKGKPDTIECSYRIERK